MTFDEVLHDLEKLIGLNLQSIRPGSNIRLLSIDVEHGSIILATKTDSNKSRPLSEIKLIWTELMKAPAVHVDETLHGSGTSRNQPETLLANLPYIEWLKIDGKKHIAFVGKDTHPFGTLKQMDAFHSSSIATSIKSANKMPNTIIVTDDSSTTIKRIQEITSGAVKTLGYGSYIVESSHSSVLVISAKSGIELGTYGVVAGTNIPSSKTIEINGIRYGIISHDDIRFFVYHK